MDNFKIIPDMDLPVFPVETLKLNTEEAMQRKRREMWWRAQTDYMQKKIIAGCGYPMMYVDAEAAPDPQYAQEILGHLGQPVDPQANANGDVTVMQDLKTAYEDLYKKVDLQERICETLKRYPAGEILAQMGPLKKPDPRMKDLNDMRLIPPTGRFTYASKSFPGYPKFSSGLLAKSSIESMIEKGKLTFESNHLKQEFQQYSTEEKYEDDMHNSVTLNKFAVNVRPANPADLDKYIKDRSEKVKPGYDHGVGFGMTDQAQNWAGHRDSHELIPTLVFEFLNFPKCNILMMANKPIEKMTGPDHEYQYGAINSSYHNTYGDVVKQDLFGPYQFFLRHVLIATRAALHKQFPENEAFVGFGENFDDVFKVLDEGIEKVLPPAAMRNLKRCWKMLSPTQFERSCHRIAGYIYTEMFLANKTEDLRPKKLRSMAIHNMVKEMLGVHLCIGRPNAEDWWNFSIVRELSFV